MKRFHQKAIFVAIVAGLIIVALLTADAVFSKIYGRSLFQKKIYGVQVRGVVLDGDTQKPISHAHILVSVNTAEFFNRSHYWFGAVADRNGKFLIRKKISRPLKKGIGIWAVSKDQKFVRASVAKLMHIENDEIPTLDEYMIVEDIKLVLVEMPDEYKRRKRYQYDSFSPTGMCRMEFMGEAWNAPGY